jgi:putative ABC transport system permease protein
MPLSVKLFVRDLLSGSSLLFLVCLITAVASLSTVSLFTDRVRQAITQQAGESLASDIRIESDLPIQAELRDIVSGSNLI